MRFSQLHFYTNRFAKTSACSGEDLPLVKYVDHNVKNVQQ